MTQQEADWQPYPDELRRIGEVLTKLENAFEFQSGFEGTQRASFNDAAKEAFAQIGIEVRINWREIYRRSPLGEFPTGIWMPGVEPIGRTHKESETDHDRIQWGTVKGLADGQSGFIREDGTKHEEPIKKLII